MLTGTRCCWVSLLASPSIKTQFSLATRSKNNQHAHMTKRSRRVVLQWELTVAHGGVSYAFRDWADGARQWRQWVLASSCYVWCDDGPKNGRQVCRRVSLSTLLTIPCRQPRPPLDHCHVRDGGGGMGCNTMRAQYWSDSPVIVNT